MTRSSCFGLSLCAALIGPLGLVSVVQAADEKPIAIADVKHAGPVNFEKEILPILTKNCLACHSATKAESGLVLETPQTILKGGDSGPGVTPKKGAESLIVKVAARIDEPFMPPKDNKVGAKSLSPQDLGLIKLWIDQGATGEVTAQNAPVKWQPLPPGVNPIYSVSITPDGQFAACGRANQIFVYHVPTGQTVTRLTDPALVKASGNANAGVAHLDLVQSLAFDPSGDLLASGSYREVKLWRRPSSVHKVDIGGLADSVKILTTSPDGKLVAAALGNGSIKLYDAESGKETKSLAGHPGGVTGLKFVPAGDKLVSGGADKAIIVWNVADGAQTTKIEATQLITALAVLADGTEVATAEGDNVIRIWPIAGGASKELTKVTAPVTLLEASKADKTILFSASAADGNVTQWNTSTGKETRKLNHGGNVTAMALRPDGQQLATAGANNAIKLWNVSKGAAWTSAANQAVPDLKGSLAAVLEVEKLERSSARATKKVADKKKELTDAEAKVKTSEEAIKTATTSKETATKTLAEKTEAAKAPVAAKAAADKELETAAAEAKTAMEKATAAKEAFDKDNKNADLEKASKDTAKAAEDAENKRKSAEKKVQDATAPATKATQEAATADAAMMAAEQALIAATNASKKAVEAVPTLQAEVKTAEEALTKVQADVTAAKTAATAQEKPFLALAFSTDGTQLAAGGENLSVRTFVSDTGLPALNFDAKAPISAVAFAGSNVLSASNDKTAVLWDTAPAWKLERTIGSYENASSFVDRVVALAFSPDGKLLATGGGEPSRSGELKIWNVADGKLVKHIADAHSDTVFGLEFSPEGQYIASAAADRFIKVFEVATGSRYRSFEGHTHHVLDVGWRADGKVLASAGADNVVKVWDFVSGEQLKTSQPLPKEATSINFVTDTSTFFVSCGDKSVRLFNADNATSTKTFNGGNDFMYSTAVTANGKLVVGGGQDSVLFIWNVDKGDLFRSLAPPQTTEATAQK